MSDGTCGARATTDRARSAVEVGSGLEVPPCRLRRHPGIAVCLRGRCAVLALLYRRKLALINMGSRSAGADTVINVKYPTERGCGNRQARQERGNVDNGNNPRCPHSHPAATSQETT
jgi:hypothetical protein